MRCISCQDEIERLCPDTQYYKWLRLANFIDHLYYEEEITQASHEDLIDALLTVKPKD